MEGETIRQRLAAAVRSQGKTLAGLSRALGRNPAYLQQFVARGVPRRLPERERAELARLLGLSEAELGGPETAPASLAGVTPLDGGSALLALAPGLVAALGATAADLALVEMAGDAMFPTLCPGDQLLVDRAARLPGEGLFLLWLGAALAVRRLAIHPGTGRVSLVADNSSIPPVTDCPPQSLQLVGRVLGLLRRVG